MMNSVPVPSSSVSPRGDSVGVGGHDARGMPPSSSPSTLSVSSPPRARSASSGGGGRGPGMRLKSLADLATQVSRALRVRSYHKNFVCFIEVYLFGCLGLGSGLYV